MSQSPSSQSGQPSKGWLRALFGPGHPPEAASPQSVDDTPDTSSLAAEVARLAGEQHRLAVFLDAEQGLLRDTLERLRDQERRRGQEDADLVTRARLQIAEEFLPVLDGLDRVLVGGERLLEDLPAPAGVTPAGAAPGAHFSAWSIGRMRIVLPALWPWTRGDGRAGAPALPAPRGADSREAWRAWLSSLSLVRQRLVETLSAVGIDRITTVGLPFDPRFHLAVEQVVTREQPAGTIVSEVRSGFVAGPRVLRRAEVVVAAHETSARPVEDGRGGGATRALGEPKASDQGEL